MNIDQDPYEVLNVHRGATLMEIRKSYRILALKYHPDKNSDVDASEKFIRVQAAYDILSDSDKRLEYDSMSKLDQSAFFDSIKNSLMKMSPVSAGMCSMFINAYGETSLRRDVNQLNFGAICKQVQSIYTNKVKQIAGVKDVPNKQTTIKCSFAEKYTGATKDIVINSKQHSVSLINSCVTVGDVVVVVECEPDTVFFKVNDHDLMIETEVSMYEYLYGGSINIPLPNNSFKFSFDDVHTRPALSTVDNKGMLIPDKNTRGNLFVSLKIRDLYDDTTRQIVKKIFPPGS